MYSFTFGEVDVNGVRPMEMRLEYPEFELAAPHAITRASRTAVVPVAMGTFVRPLGAMEVRHTISVAYVPQRRTPGAPPDPDLDQTLVFQHWYAAISALEALVGQEVGYYIGRDYLGSHWVMERVQASLEDIGFGQQTAGQRGVLFAKRIPVTISLVSSPENVRYDVGAEVNPQVSPG